MQSSTLIKNYTITRRTNEAVKRAENKTQPRMSAAHRGVRVVALLLESSGVIILAAALLYFHKRMEKEQRFDASLFDAMHYERRLTIAALSLIAIGVVIIVITELIDL